MGETQGKGKEGSDKPGQTNLDSKPHLVQSFKGMSIFLYGLALLTTSILGVKCLTKTVLWLREPKMPYTALESIADEEGEEP